MEQEAKLKTKTITNIQFHANNKCLTITQSYYVYMLS